MVQRNGIWYSLIRNENKEVRKGENENEKDVNSSRSNGRNYRSADGTFPCSERAGSRAVLQNGSGKLILLLCAEDGKEGGTLKKAFTL